MSIRNGGNRMIAEEIKQLVILYAPTVIVAITTVLNYIKVLKGLKQDDLKAELNRTKQMLEAVMNNYKDCDVIIKAAAPSDYALEKQYDNKIKGEELVLKLVKNPDIAKEVGKVKEDRKLVIFCAETTNLIESAKKKLASKNADMVVANDVTKEGAGFDIDTNIVTIISKDKEKEYPKMLKKEVANVILDEISLL